ncbi:hypothetical protein GF402_11255 [Candidatus Fermentibacteria bacterium]|nr:hypothetical protein [Candidatus Fermentibacteria bacterium]
MYDRKSLIGYGLITLGFLLALLFFNQEGMGFLLIPAILAIAIGVAMVVRRKTPGSQQDWEQRRKVLLGARRMIETEKRLDDTRLAAILEMDVSEVSRYLDFGISSGFLPADASQGLTEDKLGHVVVDLHGRFDPRCSPVIHLDGSRVPSQWGSNLYSLPPGPHRVAINLKRPFRLDIGLDRASTTIYLSAGDFKELRYFPFLVALLSGKNKIQEYD